MLVSIISLQLYELSACKLHAHVARVATSITFCLITQCSNSFKLFKFHDFFQDLFKFPKTLGLAVIVVSKVYKLFLF